MPVVGISHGVVASSWDKVRQYVAPHLGGSLQVLPGTPDVADEYFTNIASPYNLILDNAAPGIVVLQHDDLEITDSNWIQKLEREFDDPEVAIVGVIGTSSLPQTIAWWNGTMIGHQALSRGDVGALAPPRGVVHAVDGSFMAFSPWAVENLRFDEDMPGFHGYDVDIAMHAYGLGKTIRVTDIRTQHHTTLGFKSPKVEAAWHESDLYYRRKWGFG